MIGGYIVSKCGACELVEACRCTRYLNPKGTHKYGYHGTCPSKREPIVKTLKKAFVNPIKQSKRR